MKKCCGNCEFYMYDDEFNKMVCAGGEYGKHKKQMSVCDDWELSFGEWQNLCENLPDDLKKKWSPHWDHYYDLVIDHYFGDEKK